MSRILQRPMFKRGGTTNTGIMDGFNEINTEDRVKASTGPFIDPLMRYDVAGAETARDEALAALREGAKTAEYDPTYDQGLALARAGFNIASAPGGRPITQILGEVGKESIDDFAAIGQKKAEAAAKQAELDTSIKFQNISIETFKHNHGSIDVQTYKIGNFAYSTDLKKFYNQDIDKLKNLDLWIVGLLRQDTHPAHAGFDQIMDFISYIKPKQTIFTHMTALLDEKELITKCPPNVKPGYDGMIIDL